MIDLLSVLSVEPFDDPVAAVYARVRAALQQAGRSLSAMDLLMATDALALDRTLVSVDRAFLGLPELKLCSPLD